VSDEVLQRIADRTPVTHSDVTSLIEQQAIQDNDAAYLAACCFRAKPVMDRIIQLIRSPSPQHVSDFLSKYHISICLPSIVTQVRDEAATASNILHWFSTVYTAALASNFVAPAFFNADEINIDFDMAAKVCKVKGDKRAPAAVEETNPGHITLMLTISPGSDAPPPFFILGSLTKVPDEIISEYPPRLATFAANQNGWQTRETFLLWSSYFTMWITEQRRIGAFSVNQPIILFLDSHTSRECPAALKLFADNRVTVITFPSQLTHVMQPVDVTIGAPFRQYFRRLLRYLKQKWKTSLPDAESSRKPTAAEKRRMMIGASIDAARQATTVSNTQSGSAEGAGQR
jgi:hypothetical protein